MHIFDGVKYFAEAQLWSCFDSLFDGIFLFTICQGTFNGFLFSFFLILMIFDKIEMFHGSHRDGHYILNTFKRNFGLGIEFFLEDLPFFFDSFDCLIS